MGHFHQNVNFVGQIFLNPAGLSTNSLSIISHQCNVTYVTINTLNYIWYTVVTWQCPSEKWNLTRIGLKPVKYLWILHIQTQNVMWWYLWKRLNVLYTYIKLKSIFLLQILYKFVLIQEKIRKIVYCIYKYLVKDNVSYGNRTLLNHCFITQMFIVFWVNYTCLAVLVSNQRWQYKKHHHLLLNTLFLLSLY